MIPLIFLLIANVVPVYGVLYLGWDIFNVLALFWAESAIIGLFNILKISQAAGAPPAARIATIGFFVMHYGIFMGVHAILLTVLFGFTYWNRFGEADFLSLLAGIALLTASHGLSYVVNYRLRGEYRTATPKKLLFAPYSRIMAMHMALTGTAWLVFSPGSQYIGVTLLVLVAVKVLFDVIAHLVEHNYIKAKPVMTIRFGNRVQ